MFDFNQLIQEHYDEFTPQEKTVADNFLEFPNHILEKNITNLAASFTVSRNSITRFCQRLGFNGYTELKYEFKKYLASIHTIDSQSANLLSNMTNAYQEKLSEIAALNTFSDVDIYEFAKKVITNPTVKIIGTGKSTSVALQLKYHLQDLGIYSQFMDYIYLSKDLDFAFDSQDLVIVYSVSGKSYATNTILQSAINKNAHIIFITTAQNLNFKVEQQFILPNVSHYNPYYLSNHLLLYVFNDILYNAISYQQT
ncbi:MurR/RpiR family transcriptional regulator [Tetragenococcus halophilus]|uniref:MurR/RpiR family transcriptional regulator n=1 Tax=Tetragenococcus halophilus TaxID=51669 RepID=UPI0025B06470|nr:MurR/RpiR family transcriptional regulator [Tetragenococcus halophilus]WJS82725.1 MurR/RpiR family transcriptional regulator [Tetragenococcus halophilus]